MRIMKKQTKNLRGLIVGCGSIGERHLYNLQRLGITDLIVCDQDKTKANHLAQKYKVRKFYELDSALLTDSDFTFICTDPKSHLEIANKCLDANLHLFIEKPLASEPNGVKRMLKRADSRKLHVAVGYNWRLNHSLRILKKLIPSIKPKLISAVWGSNIQNWRPGTDWKNHYVLKKGGGIILDASHEYDYVRWLLDDEVKSVYCKTQKITNIKTETEGIATITMTFKKGTIANFILDYVRPEYTRTCHIIGENGDLRWKYAPKKASWKKYDSKANSTVTLNLLNGKKLTKNLVLKTNEMYVDEAELFLDCIIHNRKPAVDGWDGLKTLKIGHAILNSAKTDKPVIL